MGGSSGAAKSKKTQRGRQNNQCRSQVRKRLSAGGRWIRTSSTRARCIWLSPLCRARRLGRVDAPFFADRQSRTALAAEQFAERLSGNRVGQYHRRAERQERLAVPLGEADAIEQDRVSTSRLQLFTGIDYSVRRGGIGRCGGEDRRAMQRPPFAAF